VANTRLERLQIHDRRAQPRDIVLEMAEAEIAEAAKQAAYQFGRVIVVDAQLRNRPFLANGA
jgi:hypothetical protein